jgi:hypothetical protein
MSAQVIDPESIFGNYWASSVVAVLYGTHLTVIATLNALLWLTPLRGAAAGRSWGR